MIVCISNATKAKCLLAPNSCAEHAYIVIGTMPANSTDYWVYIYDESRDKLKRIEATSSNTGVLTIDLAVNSPRFFHPYANYYLWVTSVNADISDKEDITIATVEYQTLKLEFSRGWELDNNSDEYTATITTQTITI